MTFSSLFSKPLIRRPTTVTPATLPPLTGAILNKTPTVLPKLVPTTPLATRPSVITLPKPVALAVMGNKVPPEDTSLRAIKPKPEQPTTATPISKIHRAIQNVAATVRKPDRGAAVVRQGAVIAMPDGTAGGSPVTPQPLQQSLSSTFNQLMFGGGNAQVRATQIGALTRSSYVDRVKSRDVVATVGRISRLGIVQRPGSAVVMRSEPSSLGARDKAMSHRRKPGTPTGIQGDRALNYPTAHVGVTYARTIAPAVTNATYIASRIGGTGTATVPMPAAVAAAPAPSLQVSESVGKAYAWAPPDTTGQVPSSAGVPIQNSVERIGLLLGVGVLAFLLLKR